MASAAQKAAQAKFKAAIKACKGASHAKGKGGKSPFNACVKSHFHGKRR